MKFYIGVNEDGSEILSKLPLKRFIDYKTNRENVMCYNDTLQPPHWMVDYTGIDIPKCGHMPVDEYLTLPSGSLFRMFGENLTWKDEFKTIEL